MSVQSYLASGNGLNIEWETCSDYYKAYSAYSKKLIKAGKRRELSEDCELIEELKAYLPKE